MNLDRASDYYRKGYRAGESGKLFIKANASPGTFAQRDFDEGFRAGYNDMLWDEIRARRASHVVSRKTGPHLLSDAGA